VCLLSLSFAVLYMCLCVITCWLLVDCVLIAIKSYLLVLSFIIVLLIDCFAPISSSIMCLCVCLFLFLFFCCGFVYKEGAYRRNKKIKEDDSYCTSSYSFSFRLFAFSIQKQHV